MGKGRHIVDIIFVLAIICVFAVSALFVVVSGADVYSAITEQSAKSYGGRTSLLYIAQKVRRCDSYGSVRTDRVADSDTLVLTQVIDGESYETWIFCTDGSLREVFVAAGMDVSAHDGQPIMELDSFSVSFSGDLVDLTLVYGDDTRSAVLYPRCNGGGGS